MKDKKGYKEKPEYGIGKWLKYYYYKFTCRKTGSNKTYEKE